MTPQAIGDFLSDMPGGSAQRREAAREQLRSARAAGHLLEPEPTTERLAPVVGGEPDIGQWARQRTRCQRGHDRHGPYDKPTAAWHLVKRCKWADRGRGCCPLRGACGAKFTDHDYMNGHSDYLEVADAAPADACRKCLERQEKRRRAVEQLRALVGRDEAA